MDSIIKCPHSGQYSSKRILSLIFGISAVIGMFINCVESSVVITMASLSVGGQALTKNMTVGNTKLE